MAMLVERKASPLRTHWTVAYVMMHEDQRVPMSALPEYVEDTRFQNDERCAMGCTPAHGMARCQSAPEVEGDGLEVSSV